jgi:pimeloyl-ACP methyl ester carboxylesterase
MGARYMRRRAAGPSKRQRRPSYSCTEPVAITRCGSCRPAGLPGTATPCSRSICRGMAAPRGRRSPRSPTWGGWLGGLLDAAGVKQAAIIGHSMGAASALEAAAVMPERVTRVGLLGTAAAIPVHRDLLGAAQAEPARAYQMMTAWAHGTGAKMGGHPVPGLWMTSGTLALFARNQPGVLHADLEACNAWQSGPDAARKVRCPALVVIAANDIMTPARNGQELARLIAGSRAVTIGDCGHMLLTEAPDRGARCSDRFLRAGPGRHPLELVVCVIPAKRKR